MCRAADSVVVGSAALAPHFNFQSLRTSEVIFVTDPDLTGCGLEAYIAFLS